ncbi:MAG: hypothetical protein BGO26_08220 [Actinobacteria bacterium 69-20]|nr:hypothetical protein [Actinomycetota bacterium]OJV30303.1 MAG: hypothetical protein BGO26_08220 [Actinobacteria bacterium 69-20]
MSIPSRTGATCLVLAPLFGVTSVLIERTVSGNAADQAAAFLSQSRLTQLGLTLNVVAAVLLIAGVVWLAWLTHDRSPRLALTGGVLGVLGMIAVVMDGTFQMAGALMTSGLTAAQATALLEHVDSGGAFVVKPLSELADLGVILLAFAALKIGVPRWVAVVLAAGVITEGIGFAIGIRYVAAAGFAASFVGYVVIEHTAFATPRARATVMTARTA